MPLEDPRELERDIERLDTDYDPLPREEDNDNGLVADSGRSYIRPLLYTPGVAVE